MTKTGRIMGRPVGGRRPDELSFDLPHEEPKKRVGRPPLAQKVALLRIIKAIHGYKRLGFYKSEAAQIAEENADTEERARLELNVKRSLRRMRSDIRTRAAKRDQGRWTFDEKPNSISTLDGDD